MRTLAILAVLLAGCAQPTTNGFSQPERKTAQTNAPAPVLAPTVRIGSIRGPSNRAARTLRSALAASLSRRGIPVVRRRGPGIVDISGRLSALNEGNVTTYTYEWRLEVNGELRSRPLVGFERAPGGSSASWDGLSGSTAARMAERVARRIALELGLKG